MKKIFSGFSIDNFGSIINIYSGIVVMILSYAVFISKIKKQLLNWE